MKLKISPAEFISIIVLIVIGILFLISFGVNTKEEHDRNKAKDIAYSILESAKLTHMNMDKKETITFTEESYFDGNDKSHGPFILTLDKYENASMMMWVDKKHCVVKKNIDTEFYIDDTKTSEQTCLVKENSVNDLLTNYELVNDTLKTGLDLQNPWASIKYYAGLNPSNYVIFSDACFRIIGVTSNHSVKIVYDGPVSENQTCKSSSNDGVVTYIPWDETDSNDWNKPATLRNMLEIWDTDKNINNIIQSVTLEKLVIPNWYIGKTKDTKDILLKDLISLERSMTSNQSYYIGILNVSDYIKASSNVECIGLDKTTNEECKIDNYLYDGNEIWFFNTSSNEHFKNSAYQLKKNGIISLEKTSNKSGIKPVLYLNSNVKLTGSGRNTSPYIVS